MGRMTYMDVLCGLVALILFFISMVLGPYSNFGKGCMLVGCFLALWINIMAGTDRPLDESAEE